VGGEKKPFGGSRGKKTGGNTGFELVIVSASCSGGQRILPKTPAKTLRTIFRGGEKLHFSLIWGA